MILSLFFEGHFLYIFVKPQKNNIMQKKEELISKLKEIIDKKEGGFQLFPKDWIKISLKGRGAKFAKRFWEYKGEYCVDVEVYREKYWDITLDIKNLELDELSVKTLTQIVEGLSKIKKTKEINIYE